MFSKNIQDFFIPFWCAECYGVRSVMVCGGYEKCKLDLRFIDDTWHNFLPGQEHYTN